MEPRGETILYWKAVPKRQDYNLALTCAHSL